MDFEPTPRSRRLGGRPAAFVAERAIPAEKDYAACLKYAAIIGFDYELRRTGGREDPEYALLGRTMRELPGDGLEILRRDG